MHVTAKTMTDEVAYVLAVKLRQLFAATQTAER